MTIIVGIYCQDGCVVATDTQSQFGRGVNVKRLNATKIYVMDEKFAIAGAGTVAHIEKAVDSLFYGLKEKHRQHGLELDEDVCIDVIEKTITAVHKQYNIDRSKFLGDPKEREFFTPVLIFGAALNGPEKKSCLCVVHHEGVVEPVDDYATAGSGAAYAELVLKNTYRANMKTDEAIPIAMYAVNEVKDIDPSCGGVTKVAIIRDGKVRELTEDELTNISDRSHKPLDTIWKVLVPKVLAGEIDDSRIQGLLN